MLVLSRNQASKSMAQIEVTASMSRNVPDTSRLGLIIFCEGIGVARSSDEVRSSMESSGDPRLGLEQLSQSPRKVQQLPSAVLVKRLRVDSWFYAV